MIFENPRRREPKKTQPTIRHFENEKRTGAEMRVATVSGIVSMHCFSVPSNSPRSLCESLLGPGPTLVSEVENWRGNKRT